MISQLWFGKKWRSQNLILSSKLKRMALISTRQRKWRSSRNGRRRYRDCSRLLSTHTSRRCPMSFCSQASACIGATRSTTQHYLWPVVLYLESRACQSTVMLKTMRVMLQSQVKKVRKSKALTADDLEATAADDSADAADRLVACPVPYSSGWRALLKGTFFCGFSFYKVPFSTLYHPSWCGGETF